MKAYVCDICKEVIGKDPYGACMITFSYIQIPQSYTLFKNKEKAKIHICKFCYRDLHNVIRKINRLYPTEKGGAE